MIGVFDSGVGGLMALKELRRLAPMLDVCFLADRKNAPYGPKTIEELAEFSKRNIEKLLALGAEKVLIACCTASAAYPRLSKEERRISLPIIDLGAKRAVEYSKNGKIGVIATERSVKERAFSKAISKISDAEVFELPAQGFVSMIENGARDGNLREAEILEIRKTLAPLRKTGIDTLILGCTHFPHIENEIRSTLCVKTVNPALEGALEITKAANLSENGRTIYIE